MKKKVIILLMILLLPTLFIINLFADDVDEDIDTNVTVNNDIMINSPLFTKKEVNTQYNQSTISMELENFEFVVQKGSLKLYTNKNNGSIRIQNDITNFVWASDVLNISDYSLNKARTTQFQSPFAVNYRDADNNPKTVYSTSSGVDIALTKNSDGVTYKVDIESDDDDIISFEYDIVLNEKGIDFKIPNEKINESGPSSLIAITVFPYFGSVFGSSVPGYAFVPSGNGGLVRFDSSPAINSTYSKPYYGTDANRTQVSSNEEEVGLSVPVFGMVHGVNQNGFLASIKSGSGFASFNYEPSTSNKVENIVSGTTNGFHKLYNTFNFRQTYTLRFADSNIFMKPDNIYKQDVEMNYTLLSDDDANYIGMAKEYQSQLKQDGIIKENSNSASGNVHIDVLGGETEKGIVFNKFVKMTTTDQLNEINDELTKRLNSNFIYTLRGFYKGGYSNQTASKIKFDSRLGKLKDLEDLNYYMYYNPVESYGSKASPDNKSLVNVYSEKYYLTMEENSKYKFYANVDIVTSGIESAIKKYSNSLAIDGLYRLYGDYNAEYDRYQVMELYDETIKEELPMFKPNEYLFKDSSHYLNMPLYHDRSRFITDSVPFLQIVLRGYIDYYSTFLNFSTNQEIDLLKCIEYGSNLAYLISYEESYLISNTLSNHLYATHYESNKDNMIDQINTANIVLSQIKGQMIENRYVIEDGVVEVTYYNGIKVYVNYTDEVFNYNDIEIPSMDFKVVS